jgi:hypothetical protein
MATLLSGPGHRKPLHPLQTRRQLFGEGRSYSLAVTSRTFVRFVPDGARANGPAA